MKIKDVKVGMEYKIIDSEITDEWLRMYEKEGLEVGQIVEVRKIYNDFDDWITNVKVTNIKNGNNHGVNNRMLGEIFDTIEGAVDF